MEGQKNKLIFYVIIIMCIISCRSQQNLKYKIPNKIYLRVENNKHELNQNKVSAFIKDINKSRILKNDDPIPYIFDFLLEYNDTIITMKSDGVYYFENSLKFYPYSDLVKKYWNFQDEDLLPIRPLEKK